MQERENLDFVFSNNLRLILSSRNAFVDVVTNIYKVFVKYISHFNWVKNKFPIFIKLRNMKSLIFVACVYY